MNINVSDIYYLCLLGLLWRVNCYSPQQPVNVKKTVKMSLVAKSVTLASYLLFSVPSRPITVISFIINNWLVPQPSYIGKSNEVISLPLSLSLSQRMNYETERTSSIVFVRKPARKLNKNQVHEFVQMDVTFVHKTSSTYIIFFM